MQCRDIPIADGTLTLFEGLLSAADGDRWLEALSRDVPWRQEKIALFGRSVDVPRLTAWHGEAGLSYSYSGIAMAPLPWTPDLLEIKRAVETAAGAAFNSVLLNLYRDGRDSVSWHSDDEPELGRQPVIASVSLGATRRFVLKHKTRKDLEPVSLDLGHGSLLIMAGATQRHWAHRIPKTRRAVGPRINLTFRRIDPTS